MTDEEAIAAFRAKWAHPPLDPRDVEERLALRLRDAAGPEVQVLECSPAVRLFVRAGAGWVSRYVHHVAEVDDMLDFLLVRAAVVGRQSTPRAHRPEDHAPAQR